MSDRCRWSKRPHHNWATSMYLPVTESRRQNTVKNILVYRNKSYVSSGTVQVMAEPLSLCVFWSPDYCLTNLFPWRISIRPANVRVVIKVEQDYMLLSTYFTVTSSVICPQFCFPFTCVTKYLLGAWQNCKKRPLASSCLSVRPHGTNLLRLCGYSSNLIFEYF
jgi:hypothetical protein